MDVLGHTLTPSALAALRAIDTISISQDAGCVGRGSTPGPHLIDYAILQTYTQLTKATLILATQQLRAQGLVTSRREWEPRTDGYTMVFEMAAAGRDLLDWIARDSGVIVGREAVVDALAVAYAGRVGVRELNTPDQREAEPSVASRPSARELYPELLDFTIAAEQL